MKSTVKVKFEGAVINVHVLVGGHEIGLSKSGDKWSGKDDIDLVGETTTLELRFVAPSFTDWSLRVDIGAKKAFEDDGQSESQRFSLHEQVPVG